MDCQNCKHLSELSEAGFRYCLHPENKGYKIISVRYRPLSCPLPKHSDLIIQNCNNTMLKMEIEKVERNLNKFNQDEIEGILIYLQSLKNELNERMHRKIKL